MTNPNSKKKKDDFIDLDKSQYKKKSGWSKYFLMSFFLLALIFFLIFQNKGFLESILNSNKVLDSSNTKEEISNNIETEILKQQKYFYERISELEDKLTNTEQKVNVHSEKILNFKSQTEGLNNKIDVITSKFSQIEQPTKNFTQEIIPDIKSNYDRSNKVLINLLLLKNNFLERSDFQTQIITLKNLFNTNREVTNLLLDLERIDMKKILKDTYLLKKINSTLSKYNITTDEFIKKIEDDRDKIQGTMFESKEAFSNYLKQLFNSTVKITKVNNQSLENNFVDKNYIKNKRNKLSKAKEYLLNNDLKSAIEILDDKDFLDDNEIDVVVIESKKIIDIKEKINNLEILILQYLGEITG